MKNIKFVSVIVSTYNRKELLKKCIYSLFNQLYPKDKFEILIIDGRSNDGTDDLIEELAKMTQCNIRLIKQTGQGLSDARNFGIKESRGEIIAFIDDDGIADKNWIVESTKAYNTDNIVSVGGKIVPLWLDGKPEWYIDRLDQCLSLLDFSQHEEQIIFPCVPFGCNMTFRKNIFEEIGYFDNSFGRNVSKSNLLSHDEFDLYKRINDKHYITMYNPNALVYHQIDSSRMTKTWFKDRLYWGGISNAVFDEKYYNKSFVFKSIIKSLLAIPYNAVFYSFEKIKMDNKSSFLRELCFLSHIGYIKEGIRFFSERKK